MKKLMCVSMAARLCNNKFGDPALYVVNVRIAETPKIYETIIERFPVKFKFFVTIYI